MARGKHPCDDCGRPISTAANRCAECHRARVRKRAEGLSLNQRCCPTCGGAKDRASSQCRSCAFPGSSVGAGHQQARRLYPDLGKCEADGCVASAVDRHHVDGNTHNNAPENVQRLCRRCHMAVDDRLAALAAGASDAGRLGGNPYGRVNAPRDAAGRFLPDAERNAA